MRKAKVILLPVIILLLLSNLSSQSSQGLVKPIALEGASTSSTFLYSNLTVNPSLVDVGSTVAISVIIKNTGDFRDSTNASLTLNGVTKQSKTVTLDAGKNMTLIFTIDTKNLAGNYEVKVDGLADNLTVLVRSLPFTSIHYSDFSISPTEVKPGDLVTVSLTVTNIGEVSGLYNVLLSFDGLAKSTRTGVLLPGVSAAVSFNVSSIDLGIHFAKVGNFSSSFTVVSPPQPVQPPNYMLYLLIGVEVVIILIATTLFVRRKPKK